MVRRGVIPDQQQTAEMIGETLCRMTLQERGAQTAGPWNYGDVPRWSQNREPLELRRDRAPKSPVPLVTMTTWCLAEPVAGLIHPCGVSVDLSGPGLLGFLKSPCHTSRTG